jgi:hypothetical protein
MSKTDKTEWVAHFVSRNHQTQWAAQFAVASELCRRGHQVAFTMGNHPKIDLMVLSPKGTPYVIDVKGQYKTNFWPVKPREKRDGDGLLFYVFAFVPDPKEGAWSTSMYAAATIAGYDVTGGADTFIDPAVEVLAAGAWWCRSGHSGLDGLPAGFIRG